MRPTTPSSSASISETATSASFPAPNASACSSTLATHGSSTRLSVHHAHLTCPFPQHRPGKKFDRPIVLEHWQEDLVLAEPWAFLRGCIRSDGCAFVNRTGKYEYLSYWFDNRSPEILELFAAVCRAVGLEPRPSRTSVRVYRPASVARMLEHVGLKE